jgi:hypothetical protein
MKTSKKKRQPQRKNGRQPPKNLGWRKEVEYIISGYKLSLYLQRWVWTSSPILLMAPREKSFEVSALL